MGRRILDSWILEPGRRSGEGEGGVSGFWILGFWNLAAGQAREREGVPDSGFFDPGFCAKACAWPPDSGFLDSGFWAVGRVCDGGTSDLGFLDSGFCA